jgi:hypothetical protein
VGPCWVRAHPGYGGIPDHLQAISERFRLGRERVPVGVERDAGRRMPQLRLHRLDARALGDEQAGARMAEVVEAQAIRQQGRTSLLGSLAIASFAARTAGLKRFLMKSARLRGPPMGAVNTSASRS